MFKPCMYVAKQGEVLCAHESRRHRSLGLNGEGRAGRSGGDVVVGSGWRSRSCGTCRGGGALMTPGWVISKVWTRNFDLGYFLKGLGKNLWAVGTLGGVGEDC